MLFGGVIKIKNVELSGFKKVVQRDIEEDPKSFLIRVSKRLPQDKFQFWCILLGNGGIVETKRCSKRKLLL